MDINRNELNIEAFLSNANKVIEHVNHVWKYGKVKLYTIIEQDVWEV